MNRRSNAASQLALPGLAPICPHCGGRRTELAPGALDEDGPVSGQRWECRDCARNFWSMPSLGTAGPGGSRR
jgi:transposase-like protein